MMPFDTEFLVAVEESSDRFEINEIYNILSISVTSNFGNWTPQSVNITPLEIYQRRNNFHGITIRWLYERGLVSIVSFFVSFLVIPDYGHFVCTLFQWTVAQFLHLALLMNFGDMLNFK